MRLVRKNAWIAAAVLVALLAAIFIWQKVVLDPGNICVDIGGDGGKNYYTYLYHSLHGKGAWFMGMNYPYGEHIVYADGQPALSVPLSYLPFITPQIALAVMHLAMMLSFVLGIVFTYKILVAFNIHPAGAIFFSVLILTISPQVYKTFGHFGLSYMSVIPMLFYWSICYHKLRRPKYILFIFLLGCLASFIHPYFAAVFFIWGCAYTAGFLLAGNASFKLRLRHILPMLVSVLAIVLIVKIMMWFTDPVTDRPVYPQGTLSGCTGILDIVTSPQSPIWNYLYEHKMVNHISAAGEGSTYPGIVVLVITIVSLACIVIKRIRKKKSIHPLFSESYFSPVWLIVAIGALALGMGIPFIWNMEWLLDHLSVFRQFRTLGRFSWMFYYIISVYAVVALCHWYRYTAGRQKNVATIVLVIAGITWMTEASGYVKYIHNRLVSSLFNNYVFLSRVERNWNIYLNSIGYKPSDFQAVLTIPYTHVGSEKLWVIVEDRDSWLQVLAWRVCVQTGLPMVNVMMSRTSWSQTFAQVRIAGGPFADKPLVHLKDNRPLLVVTPATGMITDPDLKYVLNACQYMGEHGDLKAYNLYPSALRQQDSIYRASVLQTCNKINTGDSCILFNGPWYVNHFDENKDHDAFWGSGAAGVLKNPKVLDRISFRPAGGQMYEVSMWAHVTDYDFRTPDLAVECYDAAGKLLSKETVHCSRSVDNYKMWLRASAWMHMPAGCETIVCKVIEDIDASYLDIDELMIRPEGSVIISKHTDGTILANNHILVK